MEFLDRVFFGKTFVFVLIFLYLNRCNIFLPNIFFLNQKYHKKFPWTLCDERSFSFQFTYLSIVYHMYLLLSVVLSPALVFGTCNLVPRGTLIPYSAAVSLVEGLGYHNSGLRDVGFLVAWVFDPSVDFKHPEVLVGIRETSNHVMDGLETTLQTDMSRQNGLPGFACF